MKKLKSIVAFSSILVLTSVLEIATAYSQTPRPKDPTTFACIPLGENFATIAKRGNLKTKPIIIWKDKSFGDKYPPKTRCEIVSKRLTNAVAEQKGRLTRLRLTHGIVGSNSVICYTTHPDANTAKGKCTAKNTLLTLKPEDKGQEAAIIKQLVTFNVTGQVINRGLGEPTETRAVVEFGCELDSYFANDPAAKDKCSVPSTTPVTPGSPEPTTP
ncbi:MAG: COP23 domain-containing protein [Chamaesiphon sp.]|nr:COP23 domain-containing protein [Chamaesiphon sp.]